MIVLVLPREARVDLQEIVLLDERSARPYGGRPAGTVYDGYVLALRPGIEYVWFACHATRHHQELRGRRASWQAAAAGEQSEELAHWTVTYGRKLHRGVMRGQELSPIPERWDDLPFDVALELYQRGTPVGVYRIADSVTPLAPGDKRRAKRVRRETPARSNPAATLYVTRSRPRAPRAYTTLTLYHGGARAIVEVFRTERGTPQITVEVRDRAGSRSDGVRGRLLPRTGEVRWGDAWRSRPETGWVRRNHAEALELLGAVVDWGLAQLALELPAGEYTVHDPPDLARIALELES